MFSAGMTAETLRDYLAGLPPVELKGMALLRECRPQGQFFPHLEGGQQGIPRETIAEVVTEIVGYTERAQQMREVLTQLAAVPLSQMAVLDYGI